MKFKVILTALTAMFSMTIYSAESLFDSALSGETGLFEDSLSSDESSSNSVLQNYRLNGLLKTGVYMNKDLDETNDSYFITSLKLTTDIAKQGKAYADLRFEDKKSEDEVYLREGYIDIYQNKLDLRIGKQIIVWGRADAMNPTDNINPKNRTIYSSDIDESRTANFMLKANYDLYPFNLEVVVVPDYQTSELPIPLAFTDYENKTAVALKLSYEYPKIDGSFSYYHGYSTDPGVTFINGSVYLKPYEYDVFGWDFATNLGRYGFRNEFAYKQTKTYKENDYIPNPEFSYIAGIDKELFKNFSLNFQYYMKYVSDFTENKTFVEEKTALVSQQTKKMQNSFIYRLTYKLLYETLELENLASYNLDTKEFYTKLESEYNIADSFVFTLGLDYYDGNDDTLIGLIKDIKTSVYTEVKIEF